MINNQNRLMSFLEPLVKQRQLNIAVCIDDYDQIAMLIITRIQLLDCDIIAENRRLSAQIKIHTTSAAVKQISD